MLLAKLSVILSSVRWTTSKTSCETLPVWLLMATTMSRLVSFAISKVVIASGSRSGGQIEHKSKKNRGANLLDKKVKRNPIFRRPNRAWCYRFYFRQFSRGGGAA